MCLPPQSRHLVCDQSGVPNGNLNNLAWGRRSQTAQILTISGCFADDS